MQIDYVLVGKRVREHRIYKQLRQETLAWNAEMSTSYLSSIENGKKEASLRSLERIASALGISIEYLLFGENNYDENNYFPELYAILNGCNNIDRRIIVDVLIGTATAVKHSLRINGSHINKG